jgi:hypothetical protein
MAADWLAGVPTRKSSHDGGSMLGGPPRWVWHTFEAAYTLSAANAAKYLVDHGLEVHFTFNPQTGDIVQILPASRAGRGLRNLSGGVQTNRQGKVCLQVEVVGYAAHPFTAALTPAGKAGLAKLVEFARAHGIPDVFPAGSPPPYPQGGSPRSASVWTTKAGHFGHSQVPENDHGDPGAISVAAIFASPAPAPAPAPSTSPAPTPAPSLSGRGEPVALIKIPDGSIWATDGVWKRKVAVPAVVAAITASTGVKVTTLHSAELDTIPTALGAPDLAGLRAGIVADIVALLAPPPPPPPAPAKS